MKIRITDLLDDYFDESSRLLPPEQLLSPQGGRQAPPTPPKRPAQRHRMKKPLVTAAAILLLLTGIGAAWITLLGFQSQPVSLNQPAQTAAPTSSAVPMEPSMEESAQEDTGVMKTHPALDDSNSVIVTSPETGLSIRVPTEYQDGLMVDSSVSMTFSPGGIDEDTFQYDGPFYFRDTSNSESGGFLWGIQAYPIEEFSPDMKDEFYDQPFTFRFAYIGSGSDYFYTMTQFYIPSLEYAMPQFDSTSLESAQSYCDHLKYTIPMIESFIELNHLELQEIDFDSWDILLAQRMLDPMAEIISNLKTPPEPEPGLNKDNSFVTTNPEYGLMIRVPHEYWEDYTLSIDSTLTLTGNFDLTMDNLVFSASNPYEGLPGFLWAIQRIPLEDYQVDQAAAVPGISYMQNSRALGQQDGWVYQVLYLSGETDVMQFYDGTTYNAGYVERLEYAIPMLESFISANKLDPIDDVCGDWGVDFQQQLVEPVLRRCAELSTELTTDVGTTP